MIFFENESFQIGCYGRESDLFCEKDYTVSKVSREALSELKACNSYYSSLF